MKRITKLLCAALLFGSVALSAQTAQAQQTTKFAYINSAEVVALMPERDSAFVKLQKYQAELTETGQSMENDFNAKLKEYQEKSKNWAPAVVETKEKELSELQQRIQNYYNQAQQDFSERQETLMSPVMKKAYEAIIKVAKAQSITYVIEASSLVYIADNAINLLADVKKELGIPASKTEPTQFNQ